MDNTTATHIHTHTQTCRQSPKASNNKKNAEPAAIVQPSDTRVNEKERECHTHTHSRHHDAKSEALLLIHVSTRNGKPVGVKTLSLGVFS